MIKSTTCVDAGRSCVRGRKYRTFSKEVTLDPEICKKALEKVGDANTLINIVSKRVRQLSSGSRPLLTGTENMGAADIAMTELVEDKLSWEEADYKNLAPVYTVNLRRKRRA